MFTTTELKSIDQTYFHIINAGCHSVTLQSKNTGHYWHILHQQYPKFSSCKIQHKHHFANQFHDQGNAPSLQQAIEEIKDHDHFHLHKGCQRRNTSKRAHKKGNAPSVSKQKRQNHIITSQINLRVSRYGSVSAHCQSACR